MTEAVQIPCDEEPIEVPCEVKISPLAVGVLKLLSADPTAHTVRVSPAVGVIEIVVDGLVVKAPGAATACTYVGVPPPVVLNVAVKVVVAVKLNWAHEPVPLHEVLPLAVHPAKVDPLPGFAVQVPISVPEA